jgi:hypothetical protein
LNASAKANTSEVYGALGWKWLTAKYSYATSKNFIAWYGGPGGANTGVASASTNATRTDTRGSDYLELNAVYDLGEGWGITGHVGKQKVKNYVKVGDTDASYADYKVGVTKETAYGTFGLAYSDTTTKGACPANGVAPANGLNAYCWGVYNAGTNTANNFRKMSQGTAILSYSKTF